MRVEDDLADQCDPKRRYELSGDFDPDALDDDVENYPHLFDVNAWPLFGNYDPYALTHPITGLSWHLAPRVPCLNEADPNYGFWYELAMQFNGMTVEIALKVKRGNAETDLRDPPANFTFYTMNARQAAPGNTKYLRARVLPRLTELISMRIASAELAVLWGELCRVDETVGYVIGR